MHEEAEMKECAGKRVYLKKFRTEERAGLWRWGLCENRCLVKKLLDFATMYFYNRTIVSVYCAVLGIFTLSFRYFWR
jgi:hypothetical protein